MRGLGLKGLKIHGFLQVKGNGEIGFYKVLKYATAIS